MEGRLVPLGLRQDDTKRGKQERSNVRQNSRYAVVESTIFSPPVKRRAELPYAYLFMVGTVLIATLLRMVLRPVLQLEHPFVTYTLAVIIVSCLWGMRPGFIAGALGVLLGIPLFMRPSDLATTAGALQVGIFLATSFTIAAICGSVRSARKQAEFAAALAKENQRRIEREIEAREQAQDAAREANDQTRKLLDRIAEAMLTLDLDWQVLYANENAASLLDVEQEALIGQCFWDVLDGAQRLELQSLLEKVFETGMPSRFELYEEAARHWIEYRAYPTPDGVSLFARDITEDKRTRTALEESEERYRAFLSQSSEAMWRVELREPVSTALAPDQQIEEFYSNAYLAECNDTMARQYGFDSAEEIVGLRLGDLLPREDQRNIEYLRNFIRSKYRMDGAESYEVDRNGDRRIFLNNLLGIQGDGMLLRAWGTQRDITGQKEAEAEIRKLNAELEHRVEERTRELKSANKELEAFCYSVSHDLRAPLRSMMAQSIILQEDYSAKLDQDGNNTLKRLANAAKNMAHLIDDLLELSRLQRTEMRREDVDLSDLAQSIAAELSSRGTCTATNFSIQPHLHVVADKGLLRVAMMNLIENACKFAGRSESPCVEVGCCDAGGRMAFYVRDNGVGFDMKYVDKIFRPFERLHRAEDYPGTGIGLANVERVIERHGGQIWAEGELGHGATFFFTI